MKILIVDDEPPARARLRGLVSEMAGIEAIGEAANGAEALGLVERDRPDVILLDIRMPGMDGLEVARHLTGMKRAPAVIFTTAYDAHALAAFEAQALDYLLKPIRRSRLTRAIERASQLTRDQVAGLTQADGAAAARTHLSATMYGKLVLVPIEEVRFLRAEHKYVTVGYPGGAVLVEDPLTGLETEFAHRFMRVHRNALVAIAHVRAVERDDKGRAYLTLDGMPDRIEVSRRLATGVRKRLKG